MCCYVQHSSLVVFCLREEFEIRLQVNTLLFLVCVNNYISEGRGRYVGFRGCYTDRYTYVGLLLYSITVSMIKSVALSSLPVHYVVHHCHDPYVR